VTDDAGLAVADVVSAASAALGRPLSAPASLPGGSDRSLLLRCADPGCPGPGPGRCGPAGGTVVVKTYPPTADGADSFAAEAAGLTLAAGTGLAPELLAADPELLVLVMSDLGTGPSLADLLLGDVTGDAAEAVLGWARACGELSAATAARVAEFAGLRARYARGGTGSAFPAFLPESILAVPERAAALGVAAPDGLDADLAEVARAVQPGGFDVFSPGDLCPDNNLVTPAGVRLLDFEAAGIYSVFLDAAYIRMPFSTCWCVFRLPPRLSQDAETAYRQLVCRAWPELADDQVWAAGVRRGVAAWSMNSMGWLLGAAIRGDRPLDEERTAPRTRQLMRYRWRVVLGELDGSGELPALAGLTRSLLAATDGWQAPDLPLYPAFRDR
jgi:hypothetical protein